VQRSSNPTTRNRASRPPAFMPTTTLTTPGR
jgi:hypothetical protein